MDGAFATGYSRDGVEAQEGMHVWDEREGCARRRVVARTDSGKLTPPNTTQQVERIYWYAN